jgi:serine/threonine protein kinase
LQGRTFHFIREIAAGGFGSVYLAEASRPDGTLRRVAVKLLHPKWSEDDDIASRMRDEARLLARLKHPNIVEVLDLTRIDGRSAVVMEYLEAIDLNGITQWARDTGQRVPLKVALEIMSLVASALDAAYNAGTQPLRAIHRDIKPSNITLDGHGRVKVLDFGTARAEFDARESKTQEIAYGSLEYMPPERLFFEPDTSNSDVYSLAATLFEILALEKLGKARLRPPEHDKFIHERFEDLLSKYPLPSEDVEDVLHELMLEMLSFDEADRPSSASAANRMTSFARQLSGRSLVPWAEEVLPPLVRRAQRAMEARKDDPLVGRTLPEDGVSPGIGVSPRAGPPLPVALPKQHEGEEEFPEDDSDEWEDGPTLRAELDENGNPILAPEAQHEHELAAATASAIGAWEELEERPRRGRFGLFMALAAVSTGVVVLGGAFVALIGAAGYYQYTSHQAAPAPETSPLAAPEPPAAVAPEPAPIPDDAPGARFVSHLADTRRIQVRCTDGAGDGSAEALVPSESPGDCTVIAVTTARDRRTAVVKRVKASVYDCFEGDTQECRLRP